MIVKRIIDTGASPPCGRQWIGRCDLYASPASWKVAIVADIDELSKRCCYGLIFEAGEDARLLEGRLRSADWRRAGYNLNRSPRLNKETLELAAAGEFA